jgi:hypothetical protein
LYQQNLQIAGKFTYALLADESVVVRLDRCADEAGVKSCCWEQNIRRCLACSNRDNREIAAQAGGARLAVNFEIKPWPTHWDIIIK